MNMLVLTGSLPWVIPFAVSALSLQERPQRSRHGHSKVKDQPC